MSMRDGQYARIKPAVDAVDPIGLLELGVPDDEYDPEVDELAGLARGGTPLTAPVIVGVFDRWFWPGACTVKQATRIAARIATGP